MRACGHVTSFIERLLAPANASVGMDMDMVDAVGYEWLARALEGQGEEGGAEEKRAREGRKEWREGRWQGSGARA